MKLIIQSLILLSLGFYIGTVRANHRVRFAEAQVDNIFALYNVCLTKEVRGK